MSKKTVTQNNGKGNSIIITLCAVIAAVLVIGLAVFNNVSNTGALLRAKTAAESENYKVTGTMMTYFYNTQYQNYASYLSMLGVKTSQSLKTQNCPYVQDGGSWFDYFSTLTQNYVKELLGVCEGAEKAGVKLDDADREAIKTSIENIRKQAESSGYTLKTYLAGTLGNGVNEKDIQKCLELLTLADKYTKEYTDSLSYTAEELEAFYGENKDKYDGIDYLSYVVRTSDFMGKDAEGNAIGDDETAKESAKAAAENLAGAKSAEEFEALVREYITENVSEDETTIENSMASLLKTHALSSSFSDEVEEWVKTAKSGDTYVVTASDETTFTVYMLAREAYRYDMMARNVRHILFKSETYEDDTKVNEVYAELVEEGFTEEKIAEYAAEYSEDGGSSANGGLYENMPYGSTVTEFNDWLFDADRKVGDHDVVKSSYGWHIMYYVGEGDKASWTVNAESDKKTADYKAMIEENSTSVTFNEKTIDSIDM